MTFNGKKPPFLSIYCMLSSHNDHQRPWVTEGESEAQGGTSLTLCKQLRVELRFISRFALLKASVLATFLCSKEGAALKRLELCPSEGLCCYSPDLEGASKGESHCS